MKMNDFPLTKRFIKLLRSELYIERVKRGGKGLYFEGYIDIPKLSEILLETFFRKDLLNNEKTSHSKGSEA